MTTYNTFWEAAPFVGGGAAILGGSARLAKGLLDLVRRKDPDSSTVDIKETEPPVSEMPVEVTAEEAEELRRKGVQVKRAFLERFNVGPTGAFALGALGTGAAIGGWTLTDKLVDTYRENKSKAKREALRNRIQNILNDMPAEEDIDLHAQMKAAETIHFQDKYAFSLAHHVVNPVSAFLGGTMLIAALRAYNTSVVSGNDASKIKALKSYLKKQKTTSPLITMVPVEQAGSPTDQAAANAAL